jgi:hypothetical protein
LTAHHAYLRVTASAGMRIGMNWQRALPAAKPYTEPQPRPPAPYVPKSHGDATYLEAASSREVPIATPGAFGINRRR